MERTDFMGYPIQGDRPSPERKDLRPVFPAVPCPACGELRHPEPIWIPERGDENQWIPGMVICDCLLPPCPNAVFDRRGRGACRLKAGHYGHCDWVRNP